MSIVPGRLKESIDLKDCNITDLELRDQIALKILQALVTGCYAGSNIGFTVNGNITAAYEYADAMIEKIEDKK